MSSTEFWAEHQVGGPYADLTESTDAVIERALLYPSLAELMPTYFPGKVILDYGCGPGHDTLLFCDQGAGHVFYWDISPLALETTEQRLEMHGFADRASPAYSGQVTKMDHIHCAGVLHHIEDPMAVLKSFRTVLKPEGEARIMVYDGDLSARSQSDVPITLWWTHMEFQLLCRIAGFSAEYMGSYPCSAPWRPDCYAACYRLTCSRVILPTITGREESLARTIASYRETLHGTPYEIIIITDYPTWPSACNEGYKRSMGDVLHFTADDLEALPGWQVPALLHLSVYDELPAPRVFDYKPPPEGQWANPDDGEHGAIPWFTRIPIMTREQYEKIGLWPHIDYYADTWVSERGRRVGIQTRMVHGYDFVHHWSQIGRVDSQENLDRAWS